MARPRKFNIEKEATELLGMILRAAKAKLKTFEDEDVPVDAATISASVSLLKMVEAYQATKRDDDAQELEAFRQEFEQKAKLKADRIASQIPPLDRDALLAEYGLSPTT
ncbi:hypothetical protein D9M68_571250 [compost metagenome]